MVTGGARSGKSRYAEQLAAQAGERILYLATARALDGEMEARIARHKAQRPASWSTIETPLNLAGVVAAEAEHYDGLLLDCLTVFLTNRILAHAVDWNNPDQNQLNLIETELLGEIKALAQAAQQTRASLTVVTNEVGFGIVPLSPLARFFRDCAGRANQRLAEAASSVFLVVAGIPLQIKGK